MALGTVQQHERGMHADERKHIRELEHACVVKCSILAEAVPHEHHGDNSPHSPHGGECGLQREELECGGDFGSDETGVCEAYVDSGGEGGGEGAGRLGPRSNGSNLVHRAPNHSAPIRTGVGRCSVWCGACSEPAPWFGARFGKKGL